MPKSTVPYARFADDDRHQSVWAHSFKSKPHHGSTSYRLLESQQPVRPLVTMHRAADNSDCPRSLTEAAVPREYTHIGLAIYRLGLGIYHSSIAVNSVEWHFWEGMGVEPLARFYDEQQKQIVSIEHAALVQYIDLATLPISPNLIHGLCSEIGKRFFSFDQYDVLKCNCNHYTLTVLKRLGLQQKMPLYVNRLANTANLVYQMFPILRGWIDSVLQRQTALIHRFEEKSLQSKHLAPGRAALQSSGIAADTTSI